MSPQPTSTFDVLPAIDLRGGRVVRLSQGDFGREQVYDDDPTATARRFVEAGAAWIHVVDLDGARAGDRRQSGVVAGIVAAVPVARVEVAGGLRDAASVAAALAAGAARAVLGTAAILDPALVGRLVAAHGPDRIAVALDVRDDVAVGDAWVPGAPAAPVELVLRRLTELGVGTFIVTAIARDGLLGGPDLALLGRAVSLTDAAIIASGGIASVDDLIAVRAIGCRGAIVGRAIYDGRIDLAAALAAVTPTGRPAGPSTSR